MIKYPHLHLIDWPFRVVPDENFCSFLADRTQLNDDVKALLRNLSRQPTSSMHLMWAWFGAGKTHTLRHIEYLCEKEFTNIVPIYIEFPRSAKNFLDLYKSFITTINLEIINDAYLDISTSPLYEKVLKDLKSDFFDLSNALKFLYIGTEQQQEIVIRWLRTEYYEKQILRNVGIVKPILTSEDAVKAIAWLIRLINISGSRTGKIQRVLWMLDEYQRLEGLRQAALDEINGCMHSIFNRCSNGLSIIISFSGYPEAKKLPIWLSPEIKDRIDKRILLLPPLSKDDALRFVKDVLENFRNSPSPASNIYFPFTYESVRTIIEIIEERAKRKKRQDEPKPRTIMHFFNMVLQEAEPMIESGEIELINGAFASRILEGIGLTEEG